MATNSDGIPLSYYDPPNSLLSMDSHTYNGLLVIGTLATISLVFTSLLLGFITWRMVTWKSHYSSPVSRNQSIVLIYQLILADLIQSLGFVISFHWVAERKIVGPNSACFAQGWLIQLGDVGSSFFVLAIAIHTTYQVILSRKLSQKAFISCVLGVWALSVGLTSLAPIVGGRFVFLRAGVWCWIQSDKEGLRLSLHYIWIFIVEFGSILIYAICFFYLYRFRRREAMMSGRNVDSLRRARAAMLAYAIIYTILSLPLAAGRMASMSNNTPSDGYFLFAGGLFTCSGWVDAVLYTITRRALLSDELNVYGRRPSTIIGSGTRHTKDTGFQRQSSTESILASNGFGSIGGIKMERTVKVELADVESGPGGPGDKLQEYYATATAGVSKS
ncbi:G protein-coupled glucose receptor regulating Gpa2-domain-containing protein [Annulohypoxylon bovei var. microspora]|nr:G protein-coupled glucose receptor regulating Gpa2-domain-containing protein [Annulohypoxylon bovei var. microspora]